jgi:DNA polymerase I-like protein with 3'-5' exonuclease and polymerase domains
LYGVGNNHLAELLGCTQARAFAIKYSYFRAYPGVQELIRDIKRRAREGKPIRTWGGREYFVEPSKVIKGQVRSFDYKLLNYLIQGSSADLTKDALIAYHEQRGESHVLAAVHDEFLISCPASDVEVCMAALREIMARDWLDVPMRSTGKVGPRWSEMKGCE